MKKKLTKKQLNMLGIGFGFLCAIVIILALINFIAHTGKRELYVGYAPFIASVKIDNQPVSNDKKSWFTLGNHEVIVSLDGFETIQENISITEETIGIYGLLSATTNQGEEVKNKHLADYQKIEGYYGIEAAVKGEKEKNTYPILKHLPYKNSLFSLGYIMKDNIPILTISASEPYLGQAIYKLKSLDNNLENYDLNIKSPSNPFVSIEKHSSTQQDPVSFLIETYQNPNLSFDVYYGKEDDNYYYTKITTGKESSYNLITYKVVLKKSGDSYELLTDYPTPLVNIYNTRNTPVEILKKANNL